MGYFGMTAKTQQLQIRVTPQQKATLRRRAKAAGVDLSTFVLAQALSPDGNRFVELVRVLRHDTKRSFALAELNDLLHACLPADFADTVGRTDANALSGLPPYVQNYVAAMTEQAAHQKSVAAPEWTRSIVPLETPHFATTLSSLHPHLLRAAPVPFKRRNIFVDAGVGARV